MYGYNPFGPPPIMVWPPQSNNQSDMDTYLKIKTLLEEEDKKKKEKDKKKPEPPKFTFFETLGISFTFLLFGGPLYYFFVLKPLLAVTP